MSGFVIGVLVGMLLGVLALVGIVMISIHFNRYGTFFPTADRAESLSDRVTEEREPLRASAS